jgi:hypothetical protein
MCEFAFHSGQFVLMLRNVVGSSRGGVLPGSTWDDSIRDVTR